MAKKDEDDFIFIVDRIKDMVLRGGENIYCAEVESAIFDHEDVAECTVFGVADDRLGEEVGVALLLKPGATTTTRFGATADERVSSAEPKTRRGRYLTPLGQAR